MGVRQAGERTRPRTGLGEWVVAATATEGPAPQSESAHDRTNRCYAIFAGAAYLIFLPFLIPAMTQAEAVADRWWTPLAVTVAVVPGLALGVHGVASANSAVRHGLAAAAASGVLVAAALWPIAWTGAQLDESTVFWLGPFAVLGTICALVAWSTPVAVVYLVLVACGVKVAGNIAQQTPSLLIMITDVACSAMFALVAFAVGTAGLRTAAALDETSTATIALAEDSAAARARSAQRTVARSLTHDTIIAVLLEAIRDDTSNRVADRAKSAAAELDSVLDEASAVHSDAHLVAAGIAGAARRNDPAMQVTIDLRAAEAATLSMTAASAVIGATAEAARNCSRHLPAHTPRRCHVTVGDQEIRSTITDDGPGFDPRAVPPERLGIRVSIEERMSRVHGGRATVTSAPGAGTTVSLAWRTEQAERAVDAGDLLGLRSGTSRLIGLGIVAVMIISAIANPGPVTAPWVPVAAIAALIFAAVLLLADGPDPIPMVASLLVITATGFMCGIYLFDIDYAGDVIPLWITGPPALIMAVLALRGRPRIAVVGFLGTLAVTGAWATAEMGGPVPGLLLIGPSGGFVAIAIVFGTVNRSVAQALVSARARATETAAESAATRAAADERAVQLAPITALARPLLISLAQGAPITPALRLHCALTEARLRDLLRARGLCTPDLDDAVDDARRRGVIVTLLDDRGLDQFDDHDPPPLPGVATDTIVDSLRQADEGTSVRVRASPPNRRTVVTVVVESDDLYEFTEIDSRGEVRTRVTDGV
ncbi:ATP-binding protein [Gordonia sp. N1V]|uniref:sensor histidine kinase n=1 Tax=Gordonia sp. N1V TaxID=3034163 RepID=UPI0023E0AB78|nr:ATP-binding protein [Gordonia sp. N1V]MDF3280950.1 hypothetical protein [Gordonia sp. N1V]